MMMMMMDFNNTPNKKKALALPYKKSLEIALKNIRARFLRSLITCATLALAISFLSYVKVSVNIANGLLSSENRLYQAKLIKAGFDLNMEDTTVLSSSKQQWLILLSFMVCIVGIINSQLMAVTERYREIGTMKCLGALDRFIIRIFFLETSIQGFVSSITGAFMGIFFAVFNAFFFISKDVLKLMPCDDIAISAIYCIAAGVLLNIAGSLYPVIAAAKMQPVKAMRIDR